VFLNGAGCVIINLLFIEMEIITIITFIFVLVVLLFSIVIHELAHGSVAYSLGDPTAKYAGRLTLNPLKHLDPIGSVFLPIVLLLLALKTGSWIVIGWAKPVPVNPYNFKDKKYGDIKVSLAGPASNLLLAVFFGLILRFMPQEIFINNQGILLALSYIVSINIWLAIFNLIPIPPLDGSWVLFSFLPQRFQNIKVFLRQYGFAILMFLIIFGGLRWFWVISDFLFYLITGF